MLPVFGFVEVSPIGGLLIAVVAMLGLLMGGLGFFANREKMRIRGKFADAASALSTLGLERSAAIFKALSIGDDIAAIKDIEELTKMLLDPAKRQHELDTVFIKMLEEKLENPSDRQRTLDEITSRAASLGTTPLAGIETKIIAALKDAFSGQVSLSQATLSGAAGADAPKPAAAAA